MAPETLPVQHAPQHGGGLFITWCTSVADNADHAVTDEAFAERCSAPMAMCGAEVLFGPMELPPAPRCAACVDAVRAVLASATVLARQVAEVDASHTRSGLLQTVVTRLRHAIQCGPIGWINPGIARSFTHGNGFAAFSQAAVAPPSDRPQPPTAAWWPLTAAGAPVGEGTAHNRQVPSPALVASSAVSVTGARPQVTQPAPLSTAHDAAGAGLGDANSSAAPSSFPAAAEAASARDGAAGTVVPPGLRATRRDDHELLAAGLSPADPEGRDGQQQVARPRRCVLLLPKQRVELSSAAWFGDIGPERPAPAATAQNAPAQR